MLAKRPWALLLASTALIFAGSFIAWRTQTAGGRIAVTDVRWVAGSGAKMSGLLYVPAGVTPENPAPGILATHGYINSRETQAGFAIEFARRGWVVLAIDQTGHGYSDPPAFARGFGGPDGLAYLRSLDFVDRDNIGLEGHSMGGWAAGMAAMGNPEGYRSMVLAGSSTGTFGVAEGTPDWPRNVGIIFSAWDEFSPTMWGISNAAEVGTTAKMRTLFGTAEPVVQGRLYGSTEAGTARMLYQPRTNHPGDHLSAAAIGNAVDWFQRTLEGGNGLPPEDQIWYWKELGSLVALVGMVVLMLAVAGVLLRTGA
ncbi:MAG TPA: alpha/beta fold hydrolase, partial [Longimicrobiaceae bacterium]|nr:alpha/beta fold hydrolase [Longimicrobiaceae bacterium]